MNQLIFPEDVANVIQSFYILNAGDEATENLILAIGAELLDVSEDTMIEVIKDVNKIKNIKEWKTWP